MTCFYDGRLVIENLTPNRDQWGRFRGGDKRGEVAMLLSNSQVESVELAEFSGQGVVRGNHYHDQYHEYLYVVKGCLLVFAKDINSEEQVSFELAAGSILTIKPRIAHAFHALCESSAISMGRGADPFVDRKFYEEFNVPVSR